MANEVITIGLGFVNCYLVRAGDGFILIDSGMPTSRAALEKKLIEAGCKPGNLKLVLLTHGDVDHTGSAASLAAKYGAQIAIHPADAAWAFDGQPMPEREITSQPMRLFFRLARSSFRRSADAIEPARADILLEEGMSLAPFGYDGLVYHIPGHTPGSVAVLGASGDLFPGDTLQNFTRPGPAVIIHNPEQLGASVARLKTLGAKTAYPGHGRPFPMSRLR